MNTNSKFDKIMPALDMYMLAKLKMLQQIAKTNQVSAELANEVANANDILTEEWIAVHPDFLKIPS